MRTKQLNPSQPGAIRSAVDLLKQGCLVAFPTDTVYGIGADMSSELAIERLYRAKGRSREKGIPVLLSGAGDLDKVASEVPEFVRPLVDRFWPGPLTLLLPKQTGLPSNLSSNDAIAVRVPDNEVARRFIAAAGGAVATSSANLSGDRPACTAREAEIPLGNIVAAILDGGKVIHGLASTILDCTVTPPRIVRHGPIQRDKLPLSPVKQL